MTLRQVTIATYIINYTVESVHYSLVKGQKENIELLLITMIAIAFHYSLVKGQMENIELLLITMLYSNYLLFAYHHVVDTYHYDRQ